MMTRIAMTGMYYSFFLKRNIRKIQPVVSPKVRTLNVEKVSVII